MIMPILTYSTINSVKANLEMARVNLPQKALHHFSIVRFHKYVDLN
jgi:hypothetical protein